MTKLKSTVVAVSFLAVMNHAEAATKALTVEDVKGCLSDTVRTLGVVMPASIPAFIPGTGAGSESRASSATGTSVSPSTV